MVTVTAVVTPAACAPAHSSTPCRLPPAARAPPWQPTTEQPEGGKIAASLQSESHVRGAHVQAPLRALTDAPALRTRPSRPQRALTFAEFVEKVRPSQSAGYAQRIVAAHRSSNQWFTAEKRLLDPGASK